MSSPLAFLLALCGAAALGAAPPPVRTLDGLRPGDEGVCHTVFAGDEVEPMSFVVRGIMRSYLGPGRDVLLVRLTGEKPEFTGVVSGMSGSPCYVGDKLVGALSYSFASFAKEPIAGITPIADMLAILDLPASDLPWRLVEAGEPASAAAQSRERIWPDARHRALFGARIYAEEVPLGPALATYGDASLPGAASASLRPIVTPLAVAGVGGELLTRWTGYLAGQGFSLQAAAGKSASAASAAAAPKALVPGGAIAAVLVRGDVDVAATGTVTWVNEGRVLAFGHPFFGAGPVSFPMANATIVNTMASAQHSFKMATTGATVGEVNQDRLSAIAGQMGRRVRMVPVRGSVLHAGVRHPFAFDVVRDPQWSAPMLAMALSGALDGRIEAQGRGTARLDVTLSVGGAPPVHMHQVIAGSHSQHMFARLAQTTAGAFDLLWNAPDAATPGEAALRVDVELEDAPQQERVEALRLDGGWAQVGDAVNATVQLARPDAPPSVARFRFVVPPSWAGESVSLYAAGAAATQRLVDELGGEPQPQNRLQVAAWLQAQRHSGKLYLVAVRQGRSLQHGATAYPFLPPSTAVLLAHDQAHTLREQGLAMEVNQPRPGSVSGSAHARLQIAPPR